MVDSQRKFYDRRKLENENDYAYATELRMLVKEIFVDIPSSTIEKYVKKKRFLDGLRDNRLREKLMFDDPNNKVTLRERRNHTYFESSCSLKKQTSPRSRPIFTFT